MVAIQNSTGGIIIPMDGDGRNDPTAIPRLPHRLSEGFVSGWREQREDSARTHRLQSSFKH
jgi:hypothetical protein